jgi:hypothetical protein
VRTPAPQLPPPPWPLPPLPMRANTSPIKTATARRPIHTHFLEDPVWKRFVIVQCLTLRAGFDADSSAVSGTTRYGPDRYPVHPFVVIWTDCCAELREALEDNRMPADQ